MTAKPLREPSLDETFGNNVQALRRERGLTQKDLAEAMKVSPTLIQRIEGADFWPRPPIIQGLATALGVSPARLFEREGDLSTGEALPPLLSALKVINAAAEQMRALERIPGPVREKLFSLKSVQAYSTLSTILDTALAFDREDRAIQNKRNKRTFTPFQEDGDSDDS